MIILKLSWVVLWIKCFLHWRSFYWHFPALCVCVKIFKNSRSFKLKHMNKHIQFIPNCQLMLWACYLHKRHQSFFASTTLSQRVAVFVIHQFNLQPEGSTVVCLCLGNGWRIAFGDCYSKQVVDRFELLSHAQIVLWLSMIFIFATF